MATEVKDVEVLTAALDKIDAIRNSIIGAQTVNWSEHIYPLVAALGEAGYPGAGYKISRENIGTLIERTAAAESRATAAEGRVALLEEALDLASNKFGFVAGLADPLNVRAFALGAKKFCDEAIARARLAKGGQS